MAKKASYGRIDWGLYLPVANDMTKADYQIWLRLIHHRNRATGQCNPSYKALMDETELCRDSVIVAVKHLQSLGLLTIRQVRDHYGHLRNQYDLNGEL